MPRERLLPGEHGQITCRTSGGTFFASVYVRDADGKRRRVERSSAKSAEDARRLLQRELSKRLTPFANQAVSGRTTLAELFELWITAKAVEDGVLQQSLDSYRATWRVHGAVQLGALRVSEMPTSRANAYLQSMKSVSQARRLRMILSGMFALAVRFDALAVNPIREAKTALAVRKPARAATPAEFMEIRAAVKAYAARDDWWRSGPHPGRLLPAFIELLAATGARPNEVLALRWEDVDLSADPPTATITGTLIDHGRVAGMPLHRQDARKGGAPPHTVVLPRFGVDALLSLAAGSDVPGGPVFANRVGGWVSLANMRRSLRAALPEHLSWVTPHSFRRTVATVVRDALGAEVAQQQLSHAKLATTEAHYLQRRTQGPDTRAVLDQYAVGGREI
ncbi:integrase [Mycobacterium sherrisii]|uniref:Integrase n=1 Tax=Mycobacterium sherrisii TaxID=243061 RepID=A0A1E3SHM0_9MYCO|nr:tyrosine-type recombinase/integrase [Mycobacterium sherrisii]ODR01605.1 integrase [Mycobacterium sherrisii]